jgi:glycerophosphoryl diester phosphodiesterase
VTRPPACAADDFRYAGRQSDPTGAIAIAIPRLKWHKLRQRRSDPPFLRSNLVAALEDGAACEVDVVVTGDGHALCLHDRILDRETSGSGAVSEASRSAIEGLRQRGEDGTLLADPPLFLDELIDTLRRHGPRVGHPSVQLDVKAPAHLWSTQALDRIARLLDGVADTFIVSSTDWRTVTILNAAVPGMHAGFDPLALYPRTLGLGAGAFLELAERTHTTAPQASVYYLEARLVLAALERGVDLIGAVTRTGAMVDAWTIDADRHDLEGTLRRLIAAGCHQITSNDPRALAPLVEAIAQETKRSPDRTTRGETGR